MALDHGAQGTAALQALYHILTRPSFGQKPCPFCNNHSTELSHFKHFFTCHTLFVSSGFTSCYSFTLHLLCIVLQFRGPFSRTLWTVYCFSTLGSCSLCTFEVCMWALRKVWHMQGTSVSALPRSIRKCKRLYMYFHAMKCHFVHDRGRRACIELWVM